MINQDSDAQFTYLTAVEQTASRPSSRAGGSRASSAKFRQSFGGGKPMRPSSATSKRSARPSSSRSKASQQ